MNSGLVIKNNLSALNTGNTLNQNNASWEKGLRKVSSGMKINGAVDDSSGYAISEKMRERIRSLGQAKQNTDNGSALLKTAEGGLSSIKEIAARMKEMAINAANDTNSEVDREALDNELTQLKQQINDISSSLHFNNKMLLDGSLALHNSMENTPEGLVLRGLNTWWITEGLDLVKDSIGLDFSHSSVQEMSVELKNEGMTGTLAYVTTQYAGGTANKLTMTVNMDYFNQITNSDTNGSGAGGGLYLDRVIAHELTHAVMTSNMNAIGLPTWFMEGMAEAVHGADERVKGDLGAGNINNILNNLDNTVTGGVASPGYSAGYIAIRYLEKQCDSEVIKRLNKYIDENSADAGVALLDNALSIASFGKYNSSQALIDEIKGKFAPADGNLNAVLSALKRECDIDLNNADTGALTGSDANNGDPSTAESVISEDGPYGKVPVGVSKINGLTIHWPGIGGHFYGGLSLQSGVKSFDQMIIDMPRIDSNTLNIEHLSLRTQFSSQKAINKFDKALDVVTHQLTNVGAYQSRLEYTAANLTTSGENTTISESTIRDADMAKEMTGVTKANILKQTAQAMLQQANQNPQAIMSLIQ